MWASGINCISWIEHHPHGNILILNSSKLTGKYVHDHSNDAFWRFLSHPHMLLCTCYVPGTRVGSWDTIFFKILFIYSWEIQGERNRDIGRGRSRLPAGSPGSRPGLKVAPNRSAIGVTHNLQILKIERYRFRLDRFRWCKLKLS